MWDRLSPLLVYSLWELWKRWGKVFVTALVLSAGIGWFLLGWWGIFLAFPIIGAVFFSHAMWQLFRFARLVKQFHKIADEPVKFFVAPEILDAADWNEFAVKVASLQSELSQRFGLSLKRPLSVFVFPTMSEISQLFQIEAAGFALPKGNGIGLAWDALEAKHLLDEHIRHELAHLFSAEVGEREPDFKSEGFAVWVGGSWNGKPVDFHALVQILSGKDFPLLALLHDAYFQMWKHAAYPLAGSFTGYLVKQFGWETYRRFYAGANAENFERAFERHFGVTLMAAERDWKRYLMEQRDEFEPELSQWVKRERLMAAYDQWQFWLCIEEAEALLQAGDDHWRTVWVAAASHASVGNYQRALELMLQLTERDDEDMRPYRVSLWRQLGNLYDLLGQRDEAVAAYQKALKLPDWWDEIDGSTHAQARQYLKRPFTEKELHERMRRWLTRR